MKNISRGSFLKKTATAGLAGLSSLSVLSKEPAQQQHKNRFKFSLSQFALDKMFWGNSRDDYDLWEKNLRTDPGRNLQGSLKPLDFPAKARELGFEAVDYVASVIFDKAEDHAFLSELKSRCDSENITNCILAVGEEGMIGHPDSAERTRAIQNHKKWMEAAKFLGCYAVRVDCHSMGGWNEQLKLASEGVSRLAEMASETGIQLLLENHGGLSCNTDWLLEMYNMVGNPEIGLLVDFDNFVFAEDFLWGSGGQVYNRYEGVKKMMPFATAVSAKSYEFDIRGFETRIDYRRMMDIVKESGFNGYLSVEFEGTRQTEEEGILATKALLERYTG